jgi:hypothetical protein
MFFPQQTQKTKCNLTSIERNGEIKRVGYIRVESSCSGVEEEMERKRESAVEIRRR